MLRKSHISPAGSTYRFVVRYSDDQAVVRDSLDDADVKVVKVVPEGNPAPTPLSATLIPANTSSSDGPVLTATYEIAVPGGAWDHGDNGTYEIHLQADQVSDRGSHGARPLDLKETAVIGSFDCNYGVFFVNSTADSVDRLEGDGIAEDSQNRTTLRAAVMEANALPGDNTIVLGPGVYALQLSSKVGENVSRSGDLDVTALESLTIKGEPGSTVISNWSNLTQDRIFQVFAGATLHLEHLDITSGRAAGTGTDADGAGIYNSGTLTTSHVTIRNGVADGNGGGIFNDVNGVVYLENTIISNNSADVDGGGVYNRGSLLDIRSDSRIRLNWADQFGGGVFSTFGQVTNQLKIKDSSITENTSIWGGGGIGLHGGTAMIEDTLISNNVAYGSDPSGPRGYGGGVNVWADRPIDLTLRRVTLDHNQALLGGGISSFALDIVPEIVLDQCILLENSAESQGGGIRNFASVMSLSDTTVSGNSARSGGGAYNAASLTTERSTFSANTAGETGGAVHNQWKLFLNETSVSANTAGEKGGGIYSDGDVPRDGYGSGRWVHVTASTLDANSAQYGGGVYNGLTSMLIVANSTLSGNSADGQGGGIYNLNNESQLASSTITQNASQESVGGGVYSPGILEVQNTIVAENVTPFGDPDCAGGGFRSLGNNLIGIEPTHVMFTLLESYDPGFGDPYAVAADISADGSTVAGTTEAFYVYYLNGFPIIPTPRNAYRQRLDGEMELLLPDESQALAVSANGDFVVGQYESGLGTQAFRWSDGTVTDLGALDAANFSSVAKGVSADGRVVVGESTSGANEQAFLWKSGTMNGLGYLAGGSSYSSANDVAVNNGQIVVVGESDSAVGNLAFRYTSFGTSQTIVSLGELSGGSIFSSATAVSADGVVTVGYSSSSQGFEAFRHNGTSMQGLGALDSGHNWSSAADVSADGNVVVGDSGTVFPLLTFMQPFIWDPQNQMRGLRQALVDDYDVIDPTGAAVNLPLLYNATGISDSGTVIVGIGFDASGTSVGWVVSDFPRVFGFANGVNGDQMGTAANPLDPMLGSLQDNRGPTRTHLPDLGSPAIDAGDTAGVPRLDQRAVDQRGIGRPQDGNHDGEQIADIGAVERYYGRIEGVKFYDLNRNGTRDENEDGLAGWTIFADLNANGVPDEGEPSDVTNDTGNYTLEFVPPGNHRIVEELKPGWEPTYPSAADPAPGSPGREFQVNTETVNVQALPSIAMDDLGNYVLAWQSYNQDGSGYGVYAQRYYPDGTPHGDEFRVNTYTTGVQASPAVAMSASSGDFVVAWSGDGQDQSGSGIYAQRYAADGTPLGTEFQVNTYTPGAQSTPAVAVDEAGRFVIAWQSDAQDGSGYGIYARRYDENGTPTGQTELLVNTYTDGDQTSASVAIGDAGFVIAWTSTGQDGSGQGIYAQRYGADGTPAGDEFQVNTETASTQSRPAVVMDDFGSFVVTWDSASQDGSGYGVYAQRYSADGTPAGSEFRANTHTADSQSYAAIAMDASGRFVITWDSSVQDGSSYGVYAQVFDADGSRSGTEFQVNTHTASSQWYPAVAMDAVGGFAIAWRSDDQDGSGGGIYAKQFTGFKSQHHQAGRAFQVNTETVSSQTLPSIAADDAGNFVVAWQSYNQDGSGYGVYAQRYYPDGTPRGGEFRVNTYTTGVQASPAVAMNGASGDFLITWSSDGQDQSGSGIYAQRYRADGTPQGMEFRVNTYTAGAQSTPSVAMNDAGRFVIAWHSDVQDGSGYGIYAQKYHADGSPDGLEFLVNTYTAGDQLLLRWRWTKRGGSLSPGQATVRTAAVTACMRNGIRRMARRLEMSFR